jgi:hypothetical protein
MRKMARKEKESERHNGRRRRRNSHLKNSDNGGERNLTGNDNGT